MSRGTLAYIQLQAADLLMSATRAYKHEQIPRSHGENLTARRAVTCSQRSYFQRHEVSPVFCSQSDLYDAIGKHTYLHCLNASLTHEDFLFSLNMDLHLFRSDSGRQDANSPSLHRKYLFVLAVQPSRY